MPPSLLIPVYLYKWNDTVLTPLDSMCRKSCSVTMPGQVRCHMNISESIFCQPSQPKQPNQPIISQPPAVQQPQPHIPPVQQNPISSAPVAQPQPVQPQPVAQPAQPEENKPVPNGNYDSRLVKDVLVPDGTEFAPGQKFTKVWLMKNIGNTQWPADTKLEWVAGDKLSAEPLKPQEPPAPKEEPKPVPNPLAQQPPSFQPLQPLQPLQPSQPKQPNQPIISHYIYFKAFAS